VSSLDLGVIGNCSYGALVDATARVVWCCLPRFDADPVFCSLLNNHDAENGMFAIDLQGMSRSEQAYERNTAILVTRMYDDDGNGVEVTDFAPRFRMRGRRFRPMTLIRRVKPIAGSPRIRVRLRPRFDYGAKAPALTHGSNHVRYIGEELTLRLTTNAPITYVLNETPFCLEEPISLVLGPDETLTGGVEDTARDFQERTAEYWRLWVRALALPCEWQEAVIRAAITLKLCEFEETTQLGLPLLLVAGCLLRGAGTQRPGRGRDHGELPALPAQHHRREPKRQRRWSHATGLWHRTRAASGRANRPLAGRLSRRGPRARR
jgi:GH15 family glucan-1,4-alpha-glucosidase